MSVAAARGALLASLAVGACGAVHAAGCQLDIEGTDLIQFNVRTLQVAADCAEIRLTLHHVGKLQAHALGHDWVLARSADVAALTAAGLAAGFDRGYLPPGDKRIIASTRIVGGGESTTITFSAASLVAGGDYTYFCSYPGHAPMMRGRFLVLGKDNLASSRGDPPTQAPENH